MSKELQAERDEYVGTDMPTRFVPTHRITFTDASDPQLHDYRSGDHIRPATASEAEASRHAAESDGGAGVIMVDGRPCYVQD